MYFVSALCPLGFLLGMDNKWLTPSQVIHVLLPVQLCV